MKSSSIFIAALLLACNSSKPQKTPEHSDTVASSVESSAPSTATNSALSPTDCPHDGKWALCSIERRLRQSGFVLKKVEHDTTRRTGFSVKPTSYTLGTSRLEIFLYRDSAELSRDVSKLDTLTVGPVGSPSQWGEIAPMLIRSANLAAVLLSTNPRQAERVSLALTAGPPQPGSPR